MWFQSSQRLLRQNASLYRAWQTRTFGAKVAIVGSGPSGCYTAKYLQMALKDDPPSIDMLEKLPTPFGLVRSGVAPDHPEVKNVQNDFSLLFQGEHAVQLLANVKVGRDVALHELRQMYDIVVLAYGCESDRKLGIEGETSLQGILSAREFVAWYNGHPDFVHIGESVKSALGTVKEARVVVIGQGNVALDCARILTKGMSQLLETDIAFHALDVLQEGVQNTTILGRRSHVQGAFTIKELRELTKLENTSFVVLETELQLGATDASLVELQNSRPKQRIDTLLHEVAATHPTTDKQVHLRFLLNPYKFEPKENGICLGAVVCERTQLTGEDGSQRAIGTGEYEVIPADLVLVSIGYKGLAVPDLEEFFDDRRGIVVNSHGKVNSGSETQGGLYVSGWLKRGPSGIIGTNIADAKDTVASIVRDLNESPSPINGDSSCLLSLLQSRGVQVVNWNAYQKIEAFESNSRRKRSPKQPREKISDHDQLIHVALAPDDYIPLDS